MKPNLLVTLATADYIDQAKQLFSSVYFNAGWKGDYMLLAYEIPEEKLVWFREKGIGVKVCSGITITKPHLAKFFLFTAEFKKWNTIVFLDADIIVRYSLEKLTTIKGFYACRDTDKTLLMGQFHVGESHEILYQNLKTNFNLNTPAFNSGVMAFSTNLIKEDSFNVLNKLFVKYDAIRIYNDQPTLNLYFYKKWRKLPSVYNAFIPSLSLSYHVTPHSIDGICLHFTGSDKPWLPSNPFYAEWNTNLKRADLINLNNRVIKDRDFSMTKLISYWILTHYKKISIDLLNYFHRCIGWLAKTFRNTAIFTKNNTKE